MKELTERNRDIRKWCKRGYTYRYVGGLFGISRQRAHQIDHKKHDSILRQLWKRLLNWLGVDALW